MYIFDVMTTSLRARGPYCLITHAQARGVFFYGLGVSFLPFLSRSLIESPHTA